MGSLAGEEATFVHRLATDDAGGSAEGPGPDGLDGPGGGCGGGTGGVHFE